MLEYRVFIKNTFNSYKCKNKYDILKCLPVYDEEDKILAFLRPITSDYRQTIHDCAEIMGKWRKENPSISHSSFKITKERTEDWLDNLIIGRDDRLLFMIQLLNGDLIGHVGYSSFNYKTQTAEIDSILRGVKEVYPGIMTYSIKTLIWWGKEILKLKNIELSTDENNSKAISLYERCGFKYISRKPLIKVVLEDEIRWNSANDLNIKNADRYDVIMRYMEE